MALARERTYLDHPPEHCDELVAIGSPGALLCRSEACEKRENPAGGQACGLFVVVRMPRLGEQVP